MKICPGFFLFLSFTAAWSVDAGEEKAEAARPLYFPIGAHPLRLPGVADTIFQAHHKGYMNNTKVI